MVRTTAQVQVKLTGAGDFMTRRSAPQRYYLLQDVLPRAFFLRRANCDTYDPFVANYTSLLLGFYL